MSSMTTASSSSAAEVTASSSSSSSYHHEISQMIYVFTLIKPTELDPILLQFIQDVVRSQLIKLIVAARLQACRTHQHHHSQLDSGSGSANFGKLSAGGGGGTTLISTSTTTSTTIGLEDALFVLRHDCPNLVRLKSYLEWKDVRKKTKAEPTTTHTEDEDVIIAADGFQPEGTATETTDARKGKKTGTGGGAGAGGGKGRVSGWEFRHVWEDYLVKSSSSSPSSSSRGGEEEEAEEEVASIQEEEDYHFGGSRGFSSVGERKAFEINRQILKEANELTERMSREEYEVYSQARQASFVYRKSKKFRDFLLFDSPFPSTSTTSTATSNPSTTTSSGGGGGIGAANALLSDELLDVLGFLGYEYVRKLCKFGMDEARSRLRHENRLKEEQGEEAARRRGRKLGNKRRKLGPSVEEEGEEKDDEEKMKELPEMDPSSKDFPSVLRPVPGTTTSSSRRKKLEPIVSLFSAPLAVDSQQEQDVGTGSEQHEKDDRRKEEQVKGFDLKDVVDGLWKQTNGSDLISGSKFGMGKALRGWRGGIGAVRGSRVDTFF